MRVPKNLIVVGLGAIGAATARLVPEGVVVVTKRDQGQAEAAAKELTTPSRRVVGVATDIETPASIRALMARAQQEFGGQPIDGLFVTAGGVGTVVEDDDIDMTDEKLAAIEATVRADLLGTINVCEIFKSVLARQTAPSSVVTVSSMTALRPWSKVYVAYAAAKAGLLAYTRGYATWAARMFPQIVANCLVPGFEETAQNRKVLRDAATGAPKPRLDKILAAIPTGKPQNAAAFAAAALELLSLTPDEHRRGTALLVDDGMDAYPGI